MIKIADRFLHSPKLSSLLRWALGGLIILGLFHVVFLPPWVQSFSRFELIIIWVSILVGAGCLYLIMKKIFSTYLEKRNLQEELRITNAKLSEVQQEKNAIFQLSRKFVEADNESEVIDLVLHLSIDIVGATGASFVPLDDRGQPISVSSRGNLPFPVVNDWMEYLASPAVRDRCQNCKFQGEIVLNCPLLKGPYSDAIGMFCVQLRLGSREFGMLNLYLPNVKVLDFDKQTFLKAMIDETALALEGIRLRQRELDGLRQMQSLQQKSDLNQILLTLLEHTNHMLQADFTCLVIYNEGDQKPRIDLTIGDNLPSVKLFVDGIVKGVMAAEQPVILGDVTVDPDAKNVVKSILATPLIENDINVKGVLLVGSRKNNGFHSRQMFLIQTVSEQVIRIIENTYQFTNLEYQVMMNERSRLAREIHDGLAQTLGFLKLRSAQLRSYLQSNDYERLQAGLDGCHSTISDAYIEIRQAIDGLRLWPHQSAIHEWLNQICNDFEEVSGMKVEKNIAEIEATLPPEIQAQLLRIVQESLNNVRKHSNASHVKVSLIQKSKQIILEINDNGRGFSPEDVSIGSQYGLVSMRERAELIGAEYQIVSSEGKGTSIQLSINLSTMPENILL